MKRVTVHEAKTHLSRLLQEVERGEEVLISRGKVPVARLVPASSRRARRMLGEGRGLLRMSQDFDAPLADFRDYER
jgi:prevent-host-death family protein